jgi:hypothetical protein
MAIRNDFAPGEVLAAADLNDTFGSKANLASPSFTGEVKVNAAFGQLGQLLNVGDSTSTMRGSGRNSSLFAGFSGTGEGGVLLGAGLNANTPEVAASRNPAGTALPLALTTDAVERARVHSNGGMSIGTGTKIGNALTVNGGDNDRDFVVGEPITGLNFLASRLAHERTTATGANLVVESASGTWLVRRSTSSIKYKTDVETLDDAYANKIFDLRPVWYRSNATLNNSQWSHYGLIAEEVAEVDPRLVYFSENEAGELEPEGVQYDRLVPHLINIVQRQQAQIDALTARIDAMESD